MSRIRNAFNGFVTLRVDEKTSKSSNRCNIPSIHSFYLFSPVFKTNFIECSELIDRSIDRAPLPKISCSIKMGANSIERSESVDRSINRLRAVAKNLVFD